MADNIKPTLKKPISPVSKGYQKGFDKSMASQGIRNLNEVDGLLSEAEQSLKKKIFSLAKMEALVFSDPKLSAVYDGMSENGEEKYGYHYNETIMNMLFNDYVLNSPKYLQKYKQAQPKEKKRRDKSGINQLKKKGEEMQTRNLEPKKVKPIKTNEAELEEMTGTGGGGGGTAFNGSGQYTAPLGYDKKVDETTGSASSGAYVGPAVWGSGDLMKTKGKSKVKTKPMVKGGTFIQESKNYLIEADSFEKLFNQLNEQSEEDFIKSNSDAYGGVENMSKQNKDIIKNDIKTGQPDKPNLETMEENKELKKEAEPKKLNEFLSLHDTVEYISDRDGESPFENQGIKWQFVNAKYPDGKTDIGVYRFGHDLVYDYTRWKEEMGINENNISEESQSMIGDSPDTMANKPQPIGAQSGNMDMGARSGGGMSEGISKEFRNDMIRRIQDIEFETGSPSFRTFEYFKNMSDDEIQKIYSELLKKSPSFQKKMGGLLGMSESEDLMEQINNELKAFSIHQDKLKKMTEDRKPAALVLKDRLGNDNVKNFKSDLKNSSISKLVDIENSLEYADQQTDIGDNPYKLGQDIEKTALKTGDMKSEEALKNVGNSANDKGDEIPKRNLSKEEQDEVNLYRLGLGDLVYDNEVGERFENRMKADMGDKLYQQRQDKLKFRAKAPMYNKDTQPIETGAKDSVQFNKEQSGWNEREGLKESAISGKFVDVLGKKRIINFNLNEVKTINTVRQTGLFEVHLEGMGNSYSNLEKSSGSQLNINETVVKAMNENKFYTDGKRVFSLKNPVQKLNESEQKAKKPVINEQLEKMKHLTGFKASTFTDTKSVKKNRGF